MFSSIGSTASWFSLNAASWDDRLPVLAQSNAILDMGWQGLLFLVAVIAVVGVTIFFIFRAKDIAADSIRVFTTFMTVIVAIFLVTGVFVWVMATAHTDAAFKNGMTLAGAVFTVIGTLVGFVAGQAAGASGKEQALQAVTETSQQAIVSSGLADATMFREALDQGQIAPATAAGQKPK